MVPDKTAEGLDDTVVRSLLATTRPIAVVGLVDEAAPLDMVDVFRASEHVGPVADAAIRRGGARSLGTQLGVINAAARARG